MKCAFCGRENIPLLFSSVTSNLKIYQCPKCGHKTNEKVDQGDQL